MGSNDILLLMNIDRGSIRIYLIVALLLIISRLFDAITTFYATPNLKEELSPWVTVFGFDWGFMILANIMIVTLLLAWFIYSWPKCRKLYPKKDGYDLSKFFRYLHTGRDATWLQMVYARPTLKHYRLLGVIVPIAIMVISFIMGINTANSLLFDIDLLGILLVDLWLGHGQTAILYFIAIIVVLTILAMILSNVFAGWFLYSDYKKIDINVVNAMPSITESR